MSRKIIRSVLLLATGAGLALLWTSFASRPSEDARTGGAATATPEVWTCSMHPQIEFDHKDLCPLCGMDLTRVKPGGGEADGPAAPLSLSPQARMMARVATTAIRPQELFKDIRTVGRVELDETRVAYITSRVEGRVDQVFADFPGTAVKEGEHLVSIYSPQLVTTQEEYLIAVRAEQERRKSSGVELAASLSATALRRLELWGLSPQQLEELARRGKAETHLVVHAPIGGTVIEKNIRAGQYVREGDALYTIADLRQVWLVLEIYESELSWVREGQPVQVKLESAPAHPVTGRVAFVEPLLNQATRTVRVRVVLDNAAGIFKPGMYAQASLHIPIMPDGGPAPSDLEGKYVCPMHPYDFSDSPGTCAQCNMPRERFPSRHADLAKTDPARMPDATDAATTGDAGAAPAPPAPPKILAVPAEAVLTTGERQLVYVEKAPGEYHLVQPRLGPRAGEFYPVFDGLAEGDRVVVRGGFLLDSQFQISGRASLLNPLEEAPPPGLDELSPEDRQAALAQKVCPVTGAPLGSMGKPYKMMVGDRVVFLCCKGCEGAVKADPEGMLKNLDAAPPAFTPEQQAALDQLPPADRELAVKQKVCPVTGAPLGSMGKPYKMTVGGRVVFLCCKGCEGAVKADPEGMLKKLDAAPPAFTSEQQAALDQLPPADRERAVKQKVCPVSGEPLGSMGTPYKMIVGGRTVFLCCEGCAGVVEQDPDGTLKKLDEGNK